MAIRNATIATKVAAFDAAAAQPLTAVQKVAVAADVLDYVEAMVARPSLFFSGHGLTVRGGLVWWMPDKQAPTGAPAAGAVAAALDDVELLKLRSELEAVFS